MAKSSAQTISEGNTDRIHIFQVFICYFANQKFDNVDQRRIFIQENWKFLCKCKKCEMEENQKSEKPQTTLQDIIKTG